jgi:hypothetical protein
MTRHRHVWSPWHPVDGGLFERRCGCGDVERATAEAINADALDRLDAVARSWSRVFGREVPRG